MSQVIDLQSGDFDSHIEQALEWIRAGYVIIAPLETGYVFLADAFTHDAVRTIHAARGDDLGTAAQVLVGGIDVLDGIAREISESARALMAKFWPGLISFTVLPSHGLSWDLGDENRLGYICVRVPSEGFVLELLKKSGPLAVASAASVGGKPIQSAEDIHLSAGVVQGIFDGGVIVQGGLSTLVNATEIILTVAREGAVTLTQLSEVVPQISGPLTA